MDIINSVIKYLTDFAATSEATYHVHPWIFGILFFGSAIPLYYGYYRIGKSALKFEDKKLIRKKLSVNITQLFVAYKDNKPIGSATLDKLTPDYLENTYFATLSKFNPLYPSYALHNAMINYSKLNKASIYSLGRCTKGSSVYNYKKHWKAQETQLYWSHNTKFKSIRNNKWLFTIWKHLPYPLTILIGGLITRRVF